MKQQILFIVNPISGIGRQKTIEKLIDTQLDKQKFSYELAYTKAPKHATELAKKAAAENFNIVVAVGGDGSVNETAQGLLHTNTALGFMPAGSGNGLARHLNIPMDLEKAMITLNTGKVISIDTGSVNQEFFAGMSGVGLDAHIAWEFAHFGKRGLLSYIKIFLKEFFSYQAGDYIISFDEKNISRKALLISFANSSQYGNSAFIAPNANTQDGMIDICIVKPFPLYKIPYLIYLLFNRKINKSKYVEIIKAKNIRINQSSDIAHIDGEPVKLGNNLQITVNPLSLKVIVPNV